MPAFKTTLIIFLKILLLKMAANDVGALHTKQSFYNIRAKIKTPPPNKVLANTTEVPPAPAKNPINQFYADTFAKHIKYQSADLFDLVKKSTSFDLLNETYNSKLRREALIDLIDTAKMINEISKKLSGQLAETAGLVKNLTEFVEKAYVEYKYNIQRVNESINYIYYDSKSPKTFCDVSTEFKRGRDAPKRSSHWADLPSDSSEENFSLFEMNNSFLGGSMVTMLPNQSKGLSNNENFVGVSYQYQSKARRSREMYWDVECINRTSASKRLGVERKINLDESTIQVPTNIFKQVF